ncbi:MAG: hypothetical protein J3R72DRAFT_488009 [Linnemannia gamsii]|nr:MAG: hypothetical protein J3R72DRAFT_488009 [Linnemannia gamsii]
MAIARFTKDLLEEAEIKLAGGGRMFEFRRRDEEVVNEDQKLVQKTHAFCSLVDVEKYRLLEDDDPLCCMPFSTHGRELARRLAGLLIQSGASVLLCLKVEVQAIPDVRSFKVMNEEHDSTRQVMIGAARLKGSTQYAGNLKITVLYDHFGNPGLDIGVTEFNSLIVARNYNNTIGRTSIGGFTICGSEPEKQDRDKDRLYLEDFDIIVETSTQQGQLLRSLRQMVAKEGTPVCQ